MNRHKPLRRSTVAVSTALFLGLGLLSWTVPTDALAQGTPQQRQACSGDAPGMSRRVRRRQGNQPQGQAFSPALTGIQRRAAPPSQ